MADMAPAIFREGIDVSAIMEKKNLILKQSR
jgi:hypothetical protein